MRGREPVGEVVGRSCMNCGAQDLEVTRPGWGEGLRDWLRSGGRWRRATRTCRRCGHVTVDGSEVWLAPQRGWWQMPVRLAQALRYRRSRIPAPATYLLAAAAGVVAGVLAQRLFGWAWWLVTASVVAAVWLGFLSSAVWGVGPGRPLGTQLLMAVNPDRAIERERAAMVQQFRAVPLPLYGLPAAWPGLRHLGGMASRQGRRRRPVVTALSLAHGDPLADRGPQLRVEVAIEPEESPDLLGGLDGSRGRQGDPAWSEATIRVDGRPVPVRVLSEGRQWVAHGEVEGWALVLTGRDLAVAGLELVRVTDVEPYIQGTRQLEAWHRQGRP